MGDDRGGFDRDLGNGVYHRAVIPASPRVTLTKPGKKTLSWSDDRRVEKPAHNGKVPMDINPINGSTNQGYVHSHNCMGGSASSCFIEIRRSSIENGQYSKYPNRLDYPKNFYIRRHSDFIELMKSRRLESIRKNAETRQRTETSVALLERFRERDKPFKSRLDFFSVTLTFVLGLGNVLRFSHLCHQHGGGAFFIPYFVMLFLEGIPLACLEMAVGQRFGRSSLFKTWSSLVPSLAGLGLAAFVVNLMCVFYYNVMVSWCLYFAFQSLRGSLLWESCSIKNNKTIGVHNTDKECIKSGSVKYFWYRESMDASSDINQFSGLNMFMYAFVAFSWLTAFLLSMKLLRTTAKVYLVILLLIVINLVIFFFVAVELEGWAEGLYMLFTVESLEPLKDVNVWMEAAGQIFFSLSVGYGGLILFSSGNKWNNNFYSDALVISIANSVTSLWASIIMFSFFGFRMNFEVKNCRKLMDTNDTTAIEAFMMEQNIEGNATLMGLQNGSRNCSKRFFYEQIPGGMSMAFIGMTQAFGEMDASNAYACLFFVLLFIVGVSSLPAMLHILINSCLEWKIVPKKYGREIVAGIICFLLCVSNLIYVQSSGLYILELIDNSSGFPLLVIGFFECIGVCYIYGIKKFSKDIFVLTGKQISWKWKICWMFISPMIIMGIIAGSIIKMIQQGQRTYQTWSPEKGHLITLPYPPWASFVYFLLTFVPVLCLAYPFLKSCFQKHRGRSSISEGTYLTCGICKSIYESCREKIGERSGTYDLTSPKNLVGFENNALEMSSVHRDDIFESEATSSAYANELLSSSRDSSFHGNHRIETQGIDH